MADHRPNTIHLLKKVLSGTLLILWAHSCSQPQGNAQTDTEVAQDSVLYWIQEGRDTRLPKTKRISALQKARLLANKSSNDSLKPRYFSKLSLAYLKLKDSLLFRTANRQSIAFAQKVNDTLTQAEAQWDLAFFFGNNMRQDSAYHNYTKAHLLYDAMGNHYYAARMLYNMADTQVGAKDYTGAEINAFKAIELLKPLGKNKELYRCYNLLGAITNEFNEYDRSLGYFQSAEEYLKKTDEVDAKYTYQGFLQNNIGNVYQEQQLYTQAIPYYQKALNSDSLLLKNPTAYAMYLDNLAISRFYSGDTLEVRDQLMEALDIMAREKDVVGMAKSHYSMAEYYLKQWDTVRALSHAETARDLAQQSSSNNRLLETLGLLAKLDKDNSLAHTERYIKLSDSLVQEERKARDKFTRIRFHTDEFIAQNEELTRKKQIWTGVAIGIFLLALAVYIIVNQRIKNQKLRFQQQQQAANQEIFELMLSQKQKVMEGKKMEQKRISEELHDGVLGKMLGARMVLTGLNKRTTEDAIEERAMAISALQDIEGEVRAISHELSHAAYQNINNFIISVQDLLESVGNANNINHTFDYDESVDWDSLTGDIKINLYRVVQESLQNSVKHSECKNILVSFIRKGEILNVTVSDDGKGFKPKVGKKGIGMRNIESRVNKLEGSWNMESEVGQGTTITFSIPIKEYLEEQRPMTEQDLQNIE